MSLLILTPAVFRDRRYFRSGIFVVLREKICETEDLFTFHY